MWEVWWTLSTEGSTSISRSFCICNHHNFIGFGKGEVGVYKVVEAYPKVLGRLEGMSPKAFPPQQKKKSKQGICGSHFRGIYPKLLAALLGIHPYLSTPVLPRRQRFLSTKTRLVRAHSIREIMAMATTQPEKGRPAVRDLRNSFTNNGSGATSEKGSGNVCLKIIQTRQNFWE